MAASLVLGALLAVSAAARSEPGGAALPTATPLVTEAIDDDALVTLPGNVVSGATAENDRGAVAESLPMEHIHLQLRRSPGRERAAAAFVDALHTPGAPEFHQWLTSSQFGERFGAVPADLARITFWLRRHGFTVNHIYASRMVIDFSGTAGQVSRAFHTPIHRLSLNGALHIANIADPRIPAALRQAVAGVVSLHDVPALSRASARTQYSRAPYTNGRATLVTPADLATIYHFKPAFRAGTTGAGQTIAVVENSNLYSDADWTNFRSSFGLRGFSRGALLTSHPTPARGGPCGDPGVGANDFEATIDTEWASAAAPDASILLASCAATATTDGVYLALQNLVNGAAPPAIISVSYGVCEAENGATRNAAFAGLYQQAAAEGISVFVATGDAGASDCASGTQSGTAMGIGVNAWAATAYNVAVGGTDFLDTYRGVVGQYWGSGTGAPWGTAKSYVPEMTWNDTCASRLIAAYSEYRTSYGTQGFCNTEDGAGFRQLGGGEGGPSGCASGAPRAPGVVGGTCRGAAKPAWQSGVAGIPADGVRDLPDLSLFAGDGIWNHSYVLCYSDPGNRFYGTPCVGDPGGWAGGGGTSFAAPIMAGVQALVNQKTGMRHGNPNPVYYRLAARQYGGGRADAPSSACGATCVFHDVVGGDIASDCVGGVDCYRPSGRYGVLSSSTIRFRPAYRAGTGYDLATGLGSIDVAQLLAQWPIGQ